MPSFDKTLQELRRGARIALDGGPRAGWTFLKEEILRNGWTRLSALSPTAARNAKVECNLCGWRGPRFLTHCAARYVDRNAFCPVCHSYPRHRGFAWLLEERLGESLRALDAHAGKRLVFAPEAGMVELLSRYISRLEGVDISPANPLVTRLEDLQALTLADESVDFVSCFHVLEHVPDDRRALAELFRVLHPEGCLILCVPITFGRQETIDFGGPDKLLNDHCFDYGEDFPERLLEAGFSGTTYRLLESVPRELHAKLGMAQEWVFALRRTGAGELARILDER